ncbi:MAG: phosphoglucosamine mutase [Hydrotalea sp.]|nr:phosphoglucosamine mutase [Hydrotalea sp.]
MKQYPSKLFGTDGIRGTANDTVITPSVITRVAQLAGHLARDGALHGAGSATGQQSQRKNKDDLHRVVIAKDTRLSGYMLEPALTAGFVSVGMDVLLVGPIPTPGLAMLTQSMRADLGVMISASHNLYQDNGIKLFGPDGYKISEAMERRIEELMNSDINTNVPSSKLGRAMRIDDAMGRYIEFVKNSFPKDKSLEGLKIVIDCAHGAAYKIAPTVLRELGAVVIPLAVQPNGLNINDDCGSLHPARLIAAVKQNKADLGIALDGDADRLLMIDEQGAELNGDKILAIIAHHWQTTGKLTGGVVGTVMSNLGLEEYISSLGVDFARVAVGDKNIIQKIRGHDNNGNGNDNDAGDFVIGAEPSGHIVMKNYGTTGDGLMAALQVLYAMIDDEKPLSELQHLYRSVAEKTINFRLKPEVDGQRLMAGDDIKPLMAEVQNSIEKIRGLFLLRPSGTEKSILRLTVQLHDGAKINEVVTKMQTGLAPYLVT